MKLDPQHAQEILTLHYMPGLRLALDELTKIIRQLEGVANGTAPVAKHGGGRVAGSTSPDPNSLNNRARAYLAQHVGEHVEARDLAKAINASREQARGILNYLADAHPETLQRVSRGIYRVPDSMNARTAKAKSPCPVCHEPYYAEGMWPHIRARHPEYKGDVKAGHRSPRDNSAYRTPEFREKMRQARLSTPNLPAVMRRVQQAKHWTQTPEGRLRNSLNQARIAQTPAGKAHIRKMHQRLQQIRQEKN